MKENKQYHRSRLNSHSSIDNYSTDNNKKEEQVNIKPKEFPLIMKKQNTIQKYVNDFKTSQIYYKQSRANKMDTSLHQNSSMSGHTKSLYSATPGIDHQALKNLQQKCYVKYQSLSLQQSNHKIQALQNVQKQYVRLKNSILPQRKQYLVSELMKRQKSKNSLLGFQKNTILIKKKKENISLQEVQKQLKTSMVHQNGKDYYADLYLMKKQRDTLLNTVFRTEKSATTGSTSQNLHGNNQPLNNSSHGEGMMARNGSRLSRNNSNTKSYIGTRTNIDQKNQKSSTIIPIPDFKNYNYDQKMREQQQKFVQQKSNFLIMQVLRQRSQKKNKMLRGRNLHWNVYYQMLALGKDQKMKLKEYCKFSNTFGVD